jgi:hypothetical protein
VIVHPTYVDVIRDAGFSLDLDEEKFSEDKKNLAKLEL